MLKLDRISKVYKVGVLSGRDLTAVRDVSFEVGPGEVVILRRGAVVEIGTTDRVFGNPLHPYTRKLLASVPQLHKRWEPAEAEPEAPDGQALVQVEDDHFVAGGERG